MKAAIGALLLLTLVGCGSSAPPRATTAGPKVTEKDNDSVGDQKPTAVLSKANDEFETAATQLGAASDCATMCKALASMRKAAEHLCELTKDGGDDEKKRCDGAKEKLVSAEAKVKATCGGCGP